MKGIRSETAIDSDRSSLDVKPVANNDSNEENRSDVLSDGLMDSSLIKQNVAEKTNSSDIDLEEVYDYIRVGVHAVPSLSNLHIHIISKDMCSQRMKNAKHYNSFSTSFFVDFDDIPNLDPFDKRYNSAYMTNLVGKKSLVCCWCQKDFGRSFKALKEHLSAEYNKRFDPL
ncbi:Hnt3p [Sugiyamaella lignohabitans]|uniref:Hnt3p n=1 Tax=Sugiyamaella lignohabitans TaxID=796027 RepID=A0A167DYM0_9ASCO|nr:Hnt3p [Sugiyamaella lignohabitans]ANB13448.1 Hnt3p [Sugiyamaella lignohabitans]